jgi:hypothetical protein
MKQPYIAPDVSRRRVFLEENIADTMLSAQIVGGTGSVTQEAWPATDITPPSSLDSEIALFF